MTRPNTFIIGAPRCGTTAWVSYLASHPGIAFSREKEPHYFCTDFPGFRWARSISAYLAQFEGTGLAPVVAEASVQYLYSRAAVHGIRRFDPKAKILIFLRDQQSFLPSYHSQLTYNGDESAPFDTAWRWARAGGRPSVPRACRAPAFLDYAAVGRFDEQVARVLQVFPARQVHVERYETWTADPRAAYLRILAFLGLPDDGRTEFEPVHAAKRHRLGALARLTQRPPAWALMASRALRRASGRSRLGLAAQMRQWNAAPAPLAVPAALRDEIAAYFAPSNARLDQLLAQVEAAR